MTLFKSVIGGVKMKKKIMVLLSILISISICKVNVQASTILTTDKFEYIGDYYYWIWRCCGDTTMTIEDDGSFGCEWKNVDNVAFTNGKMLDIKSTYKEIGNITVDYDCDFQSEGSSFLSVDGWGGDYSKNKILYYYIVENWVGHYPGVGDFKGTITVDGGKYDVYAYKKFHQPSIYGTCTEYNFYSIRTTNRTSGTVSVMEHFKAWESLGIDLWDVKNIEFSVNGYESSGKANVKNVSITIDDTKTPDKEYIVGDINGDGSTNAIDFGMLRKYLLGFIDSFDYEYGSKAADVNGDGDINSIDLGVYKKYLLGIITEYDFLNQQY